MTLVEEFSTGLDLLPSAAFRLIVSLILGLVIGIEREYRRQPAGLRTHMLICLGATLATLLSIYLPLSVQRLGMTGDAGRIAAQIISGIGFLGAGAIIKLGANVRGITTAATIWTVAAIGMAVGVGMIITAAIATVIVLLVLTLFDKLERRHFSRRVYKVIDVEFEPALTSVQKVQDHIRAEGIRIKNMDLKAARGEDLYQLRLYCYLASSIDQEGLVRNLLDGQKVRAVSVHQDMS